MKISTKKIAVMSLLIGLEVILSRFLSVPLPTVKIGFAFVPLVLCAITYGPVNTAMVAVIADLLGATLFPQGTFFPGFTLSACLVGLIYGISLYKKPRNIVRIILTVSIIAIVVHIGLNTIWVSMLYGKGILAILPLRVFKSIITTIIEVILIFSLYPFFEKISKTMK